MVTKVNMLSGLILLLSFSAINAQVSIDFGDDSGRWADDGECDDPRFVGDGMADFLDDSNSYRDATDCRRLFENGLIHLRDVAGQNVENAVSRIERGRLEHGDRTLNSGEYMDIFTLQGVAGVNFSVELRSEQFDTFLILRSPDKEQYESDDYEGNPTHSLIAHTPNVSGVYEVIVTSFDAEETGAYTLSIRSEDKQYSSLQITERGTLGRGDRVLGSGEFADIYEFEGAVGQRVTIDLISDEFDPFLVVLGPQGYKAQNDDGPDATTNSSIEADLTVPGTYTVIVTSYKPNEEGEYQLNIQDTYVDAPATSSDRFDIESLPEGRTLRGRLEDQDALLGGERYLDMFAFTATENQEIRVELNSQELDAVLMLQTPNGETYDNDDYQDDINRSVIELDSHESGRFRVGVTSYRPKDVGEYSISLSLKESTGSSFANRVETSQSNSKDVFGVFVGISDYQGADQDLMYTADDARMVYETLVSSQIMNEQNGIVLTDSQATRYSFTNAVREVSAKASSDDLVVIFFSGHGGRQAREEMPNLELGMDPDRIDETLVLYDAEISDNELRDLLLASKGDASFLVVLDACFSGGFSKDLAAEGIMGIYSSEEFVTSNVAQKFRAGGYLARFFGDAVRDFSADEDNDGVVEAFELRHYLGLRYAGDMHQEKNTAGADNYVRTSDNLTYQRLVVEFGNFQPNRALFVR